MGEKIVNLLRERVKKSNDATQFTVHEVLNIALHDLERREIEPNMIYIALGQEDLEKGTIEYDFYYAGGRKLEGVGLLAMHLNRQLSDDD